MVCILPMICIHFDILRDYVMYCQKSSCSHVDVNIHKLYNMISEEDSIQMKLVLKIAVFAAGLQSCIKHFISFKLLDSITGNIFDAVHK